MTLGVAVLSWCFLVWWLCDGSGSATTSMNAVPSILVLPSQLCQKQVASRSCCVAISNWASHSQEEPGSVCRSQAALCGRGPRWQASQVLVRQNGIDLSEIEIWAQMGSNRQCHKKWPALHIKAAMANEHTCCMRFHVERTPGHLLPLCHSSLHRCWLARMLPRTYHPVNKQFLKDGT